MRRRDSLAAGPFAGTALKPSELGMYLRLMPSSTPQKQNLRRDPRATGQNSRQPHLHRLSLLWFAGVAARIGAAIVARLAKVLDIRRIERLAITNSGRNARAFHHVTGSKKRGAFSCVF